MAFYQTHYYNPLPPFIILIIKKKFSVIKMSKNNYEVFGLNMSKHQLTKVLKAVDGGTDVTIRLKKDQLHGDQFLPLTQRQVNKINKSKAGLDLTFSVAQLKHCKDLDGKTGGFLPLLALLPLIFGGLGAAGGIAGGVSSAVSAAKNARATADQLAEQIRHNKKVESELSTTGSGMLSNLAGKIPVFGALLKLGLEKLGFGLYLDPKGRGLYLDKQGNGFYLDSHGSGLSLNPFLGSRPR